MCLPLFILWEWMAAFVMEVCGGGGGLWAPFLIWEGPLAPIYEILEATLGLHWWLPVKVCCRYNIAALAAVIWTAHSHGVIWLCSAHIRHYAFSDPHVRSFSRCLNITANLLVSALYGLIDPSVLTSLPASMRKLTTLSSKFSSRLCCFSRSFHKF